VPAKEWPNPGRFVPLLKQKGGAVSLSLSKVTEQS